MKLKESLTERKFVVTSEVQPPIDAEPEEIVKKLESVRGRLDGLTVPELEIEGIVADTIKTCEVLRKNRFNAIYETSTREKNRLQLQKDLINAHKTGVENLLVAGRCISTTHEAMAAIRVMSSCMAMGEAAGRAASLAVRERIRPSAIDVQKLRQHLRSHGAYLR